MPGKSQPHVASVAVATVFALAALITAAEYAHAQAKARLDKFARTQPPAEKKTAAAPAIPWLVQCASVKGQSACQATQRLTIRKTGQLLFAMTVRIPPKSKNAAMMLQLPHGIYLPAGLSMAIDNQGAHKHEIQTCDQKGCYAGLPIDEKFLAGLKKGKTISVTFQNLAKKDIKLGISLSGFEEAYKKLL